MNGREFAFYFTLTPCLYLQNPKENDPQLLQMWGAPQEFLRWLFPQF